MGQFLLYSKVTWFYIYVLFYNLFPSGSTPVGSLYFPVLYSKNLLSIHFKCNSLHLLTLNYPSILSTTPFSLATTSLFSMSVSLSVLQIGSFVPYFRLHIEVVPHAFCFSLSDLLHLVWESLVASILLQMALICSFYVWVVFQRACFKAVTIPRPIWSWYPKVELVLPTQAAFLRKEVHLSSPLSRGDPICWRHNPSHFQGPPSSREERHSCWRPWITPLWFWSRSRAGVS